MGWVLGEVLAFAEWAYKPRLQKGVSDGQALSQAKFLGRSWHLLNYLMSCGHEKLLMMAELPLGAYLQKALAPFRALFTKNFLSFPRTFFLFFRAQLKSLVLEGGCWDMEISLSFSRINFLKVFYGHFF